jgi:hypothetical protein
VLVLHERKSRVTLAARLAGKTAAETISVMLTVFARIEPALRKSITFDNDTAFAQHALLRTMRAMTTWFCDAYASWQKGGVENANGRLQADIAARQLSAKKRPRVIAPCDAFCQSGDPVACFVFEVVGPRSLFGIYFRDNVLDLLVSLGNHFSGLLGNPRGAAYGGFEKRLQCRANFRKISWNTHGGDAQD